jgi:ribose transport system permease protein
MTEKHFVGHGAPDSELAGKVTFARSPGLLQKLFGIREALMVVIILATIVILTILSPHFLAWANFLAISRGLAMEGLVVIGMTILLVGGMFDLSVGSTMALSGVLCAWALGNGLGIPVAILVGLLTGVAVGLVNGSIVTRVGVNPLITTLGMMSVARGAALVLTQGRPISNFPKPFIWIGQGVIELVPDYPVPVPLIVLIVVVIIFDVLLRRARFFRQMYYIGSNEKAARLTGINVPRVVLSAFVLCGALAGLGGVISTARLTSAIPTSFIGVEMRVISAAIIGGSSLAGGEGTIVGSILGLVFMALLSNAMVILGVSVYWEGVILGTVLVLAVMVDMLSRRRLSGA